ncbi:hypothetical protein ACFE04_008673 [Oxalis oulophora]
MDGNDSLLSSASKESTDARNNHKEAEKRRRQRINAHLSTLRTLLPFTTKSDKASLLAEVVRQVKQLRDDVAKQGVDTWRFPSELDEMTLTCDDDNKLMIKATICYEDRPGLNRELDRAIESVRARTVQAEMMTVGGRTKSVMMMELSGVGDCERDNKEKKEVIGDLKRTLKDVMDNGAPSSRSGRVFGWCKRARIFQ